MQDASYVRAGALYVPLLLALVAGRARRQPARQFAACLLSLLWTLPSLLVLQQLNKLAHWWVYAPSYPALAGMPLELYLGWLILWSVLPQLALPDFKLWLQALLLVALDVLLMPRMSAAVVLGTHWLRGEMVAVVLVLWPSLGIARWTRERSNLQARALLQVLIAALIFLDLLPSILFAARPEHEWQTLLHMPSWQKQMWLQMLLVCSVPGLNAVMEFAQRGGGTPIPYDPPERLVTSGIYRYVANPMQLSCAVVMFLWATMLRNGWLGLAAGLSVAYSAGVAEWDEGGDLVVRFGDPWRVYRSSVRNWLPRWRPFHAGRPATLYVAAGCEPCSELRTWLQVRNPLGLAILDAGTLPPGSIRRMRYEPGDGAEATEGIRALGRALEHLNLGWAFAGAALRLPGLWHFVQLVMDASGLGPRTIGPRPLPPPVSRPS